MLTVLQQFPIDLNVKSFPQDDRPYMTVKSLTALVPNWDISRSDYVIYWLCDCCQITSSL
jgi:hypothetical protein